MKGEKLMPQRKITNKKEFLEALERERKRREREKYRELYIKKYGNKKKEEG